MMNREESVMSIGDLEQNEIHKRLFRSLPSVNDVLLSPACQSFRVTNSRNEVLLAVRRVLAELRLEIDSGDHTDSSLTERIDQLQSAIGKYLGSSRQYSLRPVINATGVILHTNLGRAPLSEAALRHVVEIGKDYCNLEFDLESGVRSRRDVHAESLVLRVLQGIGAGALDQGSYGVLIVNNCAAATFLALNSLADKAEVIASRGELVEIGGGFRIPEIMEKSGAMLKEVGTTNRTHLADYERALSPATGLLLRVHQSNFTIEGFAERPLLHDLVTLSKRAGIPLFEDQGTGLITSLERFGINGEPSLMQSFACGVDLIAASGDKLLGGPQCGILVGRPDLIERIRKNPLFRAFRVDKLIYAALEATLLDHLSADPAVIPVERMLSIPAEEIMHRCSQIATLVDSSQIQLDVVPVTSLIGGGTAPKASLPSCALSVRHTSLGSAAELLAALRGLDPPIVGRIAEEEVLLDLRTVPSYFDADLVTLLSSM
jgi:L-seryl-tRNA(Ser) seleniumtransferase